MPTAMLCPRGGMEIRECRGSNNFLASTTLSPPRNSEFHGLFSFFNEFVYREISCWNRFSVPNFIKIVLGLVLQKTN